MTLNDIANDIFSNHVYPLAVKIILTLSAICILLLAFRVSKYVILKLWRSGLSIARVDKAEGIILGKYWKWRLFSPTRDESHVAVLGGSGSGKTSCIGIPTLRKWKGNFFAIDISGDITSAISSDIPAIIYSPLEPNPIATTCYDPFYEIDKILDPIERNTALCNIAHYLIKEEPGRKHDAGAWYDASGRDILKASFLAFYEQGDDFVEIAKKVVHNDYETLFRLIDECDNDEASTYLNKFQPLRTQDIGGCFESAQSALLPFTNPVLNGWIGRSDQTGRPSFGPSTIEEYNIIFVLPDKKREQFSPLTELIVNQLFDYLSGRDLAAKEKILFFLDEFASFPNIDISPALQKFRKRNVRIILLFQSLAQLDRNYGTSTRQEIMDNIGITAICKLQNVETQEYFSKKAGSKITFRSSRSSSGSSTSMEVKDRAIDPESFEQLRYTLIIFSGGQYLRAFKAFDYKEERNENPNIGIWYDENGRPEKFEIEEIIHLDVPIKLNQKNEDDQNKNAINP